MKKDDMSLPIRHDIPFNLGDVVAISERAMTSLNLPTLGRGKTGTIRGAYTYAGEDLRVRGDDGSDWIVHYSHLTRISTAA